LLAVSVVGGGLNGRWNGQRNKTAHRAESAACVLAKNAECGISHEPKDWGGMETGSKIAWFWRKGCETGEIYVPVMQGKKLHMRGGRVLEREGVKVVTLYEW